MSECMDCQVELVTIERGLWPLEIQDFMVHPER